MKQLITHHKKKRQDLSALYKREMKLTILDEKRRHDERIRKLKLAGKVGGGFLVGSVMGFGMGSIATGTLGAFGVVSGTGAIVPVGVGTMGTLGARESYKQFTKSSKHHKAKVRAVVIGTPAWKKYQAKLKKR